MSLYLFSKRNLEQLKNPLWRQALFSFDFDGTLARLVKAPDEAGLSPETLSLLGRLASQTEVAIISGRSRRDLRRKVNLKHVELIGNHGLEGGWNRSADLRKAKKVCNQWKAKLEGAGFIVEDKTYTLTLHYRGRSIVERKALSQAIQSLQPIPRIIGGKYVFNLIPEGAPDKGKALLHLMAQKRKRRAFYIGDDETDEDVFRISGERIFSVRVGKKNGSSARYFIRGQSQMDVLLELLNELTARSI